MQTNVTCRADGPTPALQVSHLAKHFGGIEAIRDVSLDLPTGSVLGVIGPNGSGKTTLINLLSGAYHPDKGSIQVLGVAANRMSAHRISALGLARTFQNPHVFKSLTVRQNLFVSVQHRAGHAMLRQLRADVDEWLEIVGLDGVADRVAHELSGGQQKLVEFARAMVHRPAVVLMDEPFAGVHTDVKQVLHTRIASIARESSSAFLIVSHEIPDLVSLADTLVCMAGGSILTSGLPADVCREQRVIDAYLGARRKDVA
jgi:ABC-type branched-subunit amino acid transport system ATPase component